MLKFTEHFDEIIVDREDGTCLGAIQESRKLFLSKFREAIVTQYELRKIREKIKSLENGE